MPSIDIQDNYNSFVSKIFGPFAIKDYVRPKEFLGVISDLEKIANKSLIELKEENPNLLIFPEDLSFLQDGFDDKDKAVFMLYPRVNPQFLETGNVMGWIGCGNTQLKIFSRFDSGLSFIDPSLVDQQAKHKKNLTKSSKKDFFMLYLLSRVGAFHITALDYSEGKDSLLDSLLMLMLPECLKNAVSQGLYKEYKSYDKNDSNIRGLIESSRHIRLNIPFVGKVAYRTREYSFDNNVTQLIRHTIEFMKESPIGKHVLSNDAEIKQCIEMIYQATPTYDIKCRGKIINNNLRPKVHPYYIGYNYLQKLCLQILYEEGISYGVESDDKVHGILFDGAWLWEAYINQLLEESGLGFIHPDNIARINAYKMFKTDHDDVAGVNRSAYPDFYNDLCVLDAKYKHLEKRVQREDLFQVISYMHTMPRSVGGYIYPYQSNQEENLPLIKDYYLNGQNGDGGKISTIPFIIPYYKNNCKWDSFLEAMQKAEDDFKQMIQNKFNNR